MTEHSFHGIHTSPAKGKGVTHVSGTICHLCLGPLNQQTIAGGTHAARTPPNERAWES
jgi:hypothetical protein